MNMRVKLALGIAVTGALAVAGTAAVAGGGTQIRGSLHGYEEVPSVSTVANGSFQATVTSADDTISFRLRYANLEGSVSAAHVHFAQAAQNGGISAFLCGGGGKPACPPAPATVEGTIVAADVIGPAGQGIAAGELDELLRAIRAGVTYANVHSSKFPGGEIRSQLRASTRRGDDD